MIYWSKFGKAMFLASLDFWRFKKHYLNPNFKGSLCGISIRTLNICRTWKGAMEVVISLREEVRNPASGNPLEKLEGAGSSDQLTRGDFSVYRGCVW